MYSFFTFISLSLMIVLSSCSSNGTAGLPDEPKTPDQVSDTIALRITSQLDVQEESIISRAGNSNDLIGVEIIRKIAGSASNPDVPTSIIYASGVFDDIADIVFKFVKGGTYSINMTYYPNAKNIVYNYPDGTYGAPFSYIYGLQSYKLNVPAYYSGTEGGWSGDQGPILPYLLDDVYQPADDRYYQSFRRGDTPRYSGQIKDITVDENTSITIKLELCMMAITLQPQNFTEGALSVSFTNYRNLENENSIWIVHPGDDMTKKVQIPYIPSEEGIELFYTDKNGEKFLLATKQLERKHCANFVFKFALSERADGSIGIQMPSNDLFSDEDATFDY